MKDILFAFCCGVFVAACLLPGLGDTSNNIPPTPEPPPHVTVKLRDQYDRELQKPILVPAGETLNLKIHFEGKCKVAGSEVVY